MDERFSWAGGMESLYLISNVDSISPARRRKEGLGMKKRILLEWVSISLVISFAVYLLLSQGKMSMHEIIDAALIGIAVPATLYYLFRGFFPNHKSETR